jgi:hypothetical protein
MKKPWATAEKKNMMGTKERKGAKGGVDQR